MSITEKDLEKIVSQVVKNIEGAITNKNIEIPKNLAPIKINDHHLKGVFEEIEAAIKATSEAQKQLMLEYRIEDRQRFIQAIRKKALENAEKMSQMGLEETGMGNLKDKIIKHKVVAELTPGTEILKTDAYSGDHGLTIEEMAPFGVIGAITPSTNPSETIISNSIAMLAGGNAVVFNPHPGAKNTSTFAVDMINRAIIEEGGPENLVTTIFNPTLDTVEAIIHHPEVKLLCGTGGSQLVKKLLSSGKKAIGAGAGNPPVIVDDTADIPKAAKAVLDGATFDNNIPCIAEKEVFVLEAVADDLIYHMLKNGAVMLDRQQTEAVMKTVLTEKEDLKAASCSGEKPRKTYGASKEWVGKDAKLILKEIGVAYKEDTRCVICEVEGDHPFVMTEMMMPVLPIVRVESIEEAIELAKKAEGGNGHSAIMHSKNIDNLTRFAKEIGTTIFVKNAPSYAGIGVGGEGFCSFTIAGPTGEGVTNARSFTRKRRCVLAEGFKIV
ncbi:propionaldehyde dehydrogenase [Natronincola peptidivorans]|uniref:Propionaldehyde dehydrogenase n=1 Tax=Natronincola peptidivorans TaxID=426128 RepID=A0A1I0CYM1_9FIRM|nr:aldehyde dehydrogenase family protein [Natronincola peptidivorans]SET24973.1 propionaldehyde dehydrogenase [Natronincola peptidivorans]